ncbi:MAG: RDD family protein, partial [Planctomycetota bacterium]
RATLGKRWLGIEVTDIDLQRIRWPMALVRTIVKLIPWEIAHASALLPTPVYDGAKDAAARPGFMVSTMLVGAWLVTVMLTPKSQGVHDLIANTVVVPAEPERSG